MHTYDVALDYPSMLIDPPHIALTSPITIDRLRLVTPVAHLRVVGAQLRVLNEILLETGILELDGGTLVGSTLNIDGGLLDVRMGTLSGLTLVGNVDLYRPYATLTVLGGFALDGSIALRGNNTRLRFVGDQHLDGGVLSLSATFPTGSPSSSIDTTGGTLSLSAKTNVIGQTGAFTGTGRLISHAAMDFGGGGEHAVRFAVDEMLNYGSIVASNTGLRFECPLANYGRIGSSAQDIEITAPLHNFGTIRSIDSDIWLSGGQTIEALQGLETLGGALRISGTLDLLNDTFDVAAATQSLILATSRIEHGRIDNPERISVLPNTMVTLRDLTLAGDLALGNTAEATIEKDVVTHGSLVLAGNGSRVYLQSGLTHDNLGIRLVYPRSSNRVRTTGTLPTVFGPNFVLRGGHSTWESSAVLSITQPLALYGTIAADEGLLSVRLSDFQNHGTIESHGTATLRFNYPDCGTCPLPVWTNEPDGILRTLGGEMRLSGSWVHRGTMELLGGTTRLDGVLRLDPEGTYVRGGGTLTLGGTLDNTGQVLQIAPPLAPLESIGGRILGGRVHVPASDNLIAAYSLILEDTMLTGVVGIGGLPPLNSARVVTILPGTHVEADFEIRRSGVLRFAGNAGYSSGTAIFEPIDFHNQFPAIELSTGFLGPDVVVRGAAGTVTGAGATNYGQIVAEVPNQEIAVVLAENRGTIAATNEARLRFTGHNTASGQITVDGGQLNCKGAWRNSGTIALSNATAILEGTFHGGDLYGFTSENSTIGLRYATVDCATAPILVGPGHAPIQAWDAKFVGGEIHVAEGAALVVERVFGATYPTAEFSGTTFHGDLIVGRSAQILFRNQAAHLGRIVADTPTIGSPKLDFVGLDCTQPIEVVARRTDLTVAADQMLGPHAKLTLEACNLYHQPATDNLVNRSDLTVTGPSTLLLGFIGYNTPRTFRNEGRLSAENGAVIEWYGPWTFEDDEFGVLVRGRWEVHGGGQIKMNGSLYQNFAEIVVRGEGSRFWPLHGLIQNHGLLTFADNHTHHSDEVFENYGRLELGSGVTFRTGNSFELLAGTLVIELGPGDEQAHVVVEDGNALLGALLEVRVLPGFSSPGGARYTIMSAGLIEGDFEDVIIEWHPDYRISLERTATEVALVVSERLPCPGDLNCDGHVNFADIHLFIQAVKTTDPLAWSADPANGVCPYDYGDFTNDGLVTFADISWFIARIKDQTPCP